MAVKRRQKDDNHGTLEDKSQGPLVSDKGREREIARRGDPEMSLKTLSLLPSLICIRVLIKAELLPISNPGLCSMISERL